MRNSGDFVASHLVVGEMILDAASVASVGSFHASCSLGLVTDVVVFHNPYDVACSNFQARKYNQ